MLNDGIESLVCKSEERLSGVKLYTLELFEYQFKALLELNFRFTNLIEERHVNSSIYYVCKMILYFFN